MKFKIGDKVKIKKNLGKEFKHIGDFGTRKIRLISKSKWISVERDAGSYHKDFLEKV